MFARRRSDQTWQEVLDEIESDDDLGRSPDPDVWQRIVERAQQLLAEVSLFVTEHYGEIDHEPTHIQVSLSADWAEMHVPYGDTGADAAATLRVMYMLGGVIQEETGLEGYDPQVEQPLNEAAAEIGLGLASFEAVAEMFRTRTPRS